MEGPDEFIGVRLAWRAALGGIDPFAGTPGEACPENPAGRGWTRLWPHLPEGKDLPLPHIEDPEQLITVGSSLPTPHGFGPLQPGWKPRHNYAGTSDDAWCRQRAPLWPEDFSEQFYQAAPTDQVYPSQLRGGELVEIEGLHPDGPYSYRLPQLIIESRTRLSNQPVDRRLRPVSVTIDASAKKAEMTWNASVFCHGRDHEIEKSTVSLRQIAGVA